MDRQYVINWLKYDARATFFAVAMQYINWEGVEGDILEFGVSVGRSLGLLGLSYQENLAWWQYTDPACLERRVVGFDTFTGLPATNEIHPRWQTGSFGANYLNDHPFLAPGEPLSAASVEKIFVACGLPRPELHTGLFQDTAPAVIPSRYQKAALVHIDCDLYASTLVALEAVAPILQDGTLLLFDDWFMYRGNPNKGEAGALRKFLAANPHWEAIPYQTYSVFCNSFILSRGAKSVAVEQK